MKTRTTLKMKLDKVNTKATTYMMMAWDLLREVSNNKTSDDVIQQKMELEYWRGRSVTASAVRHAK